MEHPPRQRTEQARSARPPLQSPAHPATARRLRGMDRRSLYLPPRLAGFRYGIDIYLTNITSLSFWTIMPRLGHVNGTTASSRGRLRRNPAVHAEGLALPVEPLGRWRRAVLA